jgi:sterol desaturase/sphingolipid hydroxylase (fatty acid hydroxylase superfamily)
LWQRLLLVEIAFHHADLRLPLRLERRLARFVVTPRMHGIHHSIVAAETDSNWSSGLTLWDRLHGTLRLDVPPQRVVIGAPGGVPPAFVRFPKLLAVPLLPLPENEEGAPTTPGPPSCVA